MTETMLLTLVLTSAITPVAPTDGWIDTNIRYSHYYPGWGGTNCGAFVDGRCVSRMASGKPWKPWVGRGAACPPSWPFGTTVRLDEREWVCLDRGGAVQFVDGIPYVDFLTKSAAYGYGQIIPAQIKLPPDAPATRPGHAAVSRPGPVSDTNNPDRAGVSGPNYPRRMLKGDRPLTRNVFHSIIVR